MLPIADLVGLLSVRESKFNVRRGAVCDHLIVTLGHFVECLCVHVKSLGTLRLRKLLNAPFEEGKGHLRERLMLAEAISLRKIEIDLGFLLL